MTSASRNIAISMVILCAVLATACTGSVESREIPTPQPPEPFPAPRGLELPADDASHDAPIEWWYYNGHLISEKGAEYSFHFVIFQTENDDRTASFEIGQAGITDVENAEHVNIRSQGFGYSAEDAQSSADALLKLDLGNFALEINSEGEHAFSASGTDEKASLSLKTAAPTATMLHEEIGWMEWPFGWTYYYSYPRLKAEGSITIDGQENTVKGEVWFDHQWGDFFVVGKPAGWQWFAIHLDDGGSLMISEVRDAEGQVLSIDGTLISSDSSHNVLEADKDGIMIDVKDHWVSPATRGEYPSMWRLRVASVDLDVTMKAIVADQEVPAAPYGNQAAAYWEGRLTVRDTSSGNIIGRAFAELSGYVDPPPLSWRGEPR